MTESKRLTAELQLAAEPEESHKRRILADANVQALREELLGKGLNEAQFDRLVCRTAELPRHWKRYYQRETTLECEKRHEKVRAKIRELATLIDEDPELQNVRVQVDELKRIALVRGGGSLQPLPDDFESLPEFIADLVEQSFSHTWPTTDQKRGLDWFAIHGLFDKLESWLPWLWVTHPKKACELADRGTHTRPNSEFYYVPTGGPFNHTLMIGKVEYDAFHGKRYPNREVAILVSALVGRRVTAERVSKAREGDRRAYYKD